MTRALVAGAAALVVAGLVVRASIARDGVIALADADARRALIVRAAGAGLGAALAIGVATGGAA